MKKKFFAPGLKKHGLCTIIIVERLRKEKAMEPEKKTTKKIDLLTAVEKIVDLSKGSQLNTEFYRKAARPIKYLMD